MPFQQRRITGGGVQNVRTPALLIRVPFLERKFVYFLYQNSEFLFLLTNITGNASKAHHFDIRNHVSCFAIYSSTQRLYSQPPDTTAAGFDILINWNLLVAELFTALFVTGVTASEHQTKTFRQPTFRCLQNNLSSQLLWTRSSSQVSRGYTCKAGRMSTGY